MTKRITPQLAALAAGVAIGLALTVRRKRRERRPVELFAETVVDLPPDRVFMAWADLERIPRWSARVAEVVVYGDGRLSAWAVDGPGGWPLEFDAKLTDLEPGRLLAWKTLAGSVIQHHGRVTFVAAGAGTRVAVRAWWTPPRGVIGQAAAAATGSAQRVLAAELGRMKEALEAPATRS